MKKTVLTAEIRADIEKGMSDAELMKKYGLSDKGLKRLFEKLLKAMSAGANHIQVETETSE